MKIAIVGAGFCGLATAWHFLNHPARPGSLSITIFDEQGVGGGASGISAGLLHPFAGAHAKLNWRGKEGIDATKELLNTASSTLKLPVTSPTSGILRLALTEEQEKDFKLCAERYPNDVEWLSKENCQQLAPGCILKPGLKIKYGLTVYSSLYLKGLWKACNDKDAQLILKKIKHLDELQHFDLVILAAGYESIHFPDLANSSLNLVKGQVLELQWPNDIPPLAYPLNSHIYIVMRESMQSCFVGATYERNFTNARIDLEKAKNELLDKACELYPPLRGTPILGCYAGIRLTAPHHRPFVKQLTPSTWAITGMGSKGLLYHALFAKELVDRIFF